MFNYDQFSEAILTQINDFHDYEKSVRKQLSDVDIRLSDYYHDLEKSRFNACEGYYKAKELQGLLLERRKIKLELAKIQSMSAKLGIKQIEKNVLHSTKRVKVVEKRYSKKFKCN